LSFKKKALSGIFWSSIQTFGTQCVSFVISIILARLLLPEEFGLIAMITVFMGIGNTLLNAGLGESLIRTKDPTEEDYSTVFFFNLIGSVIVYAIIYFSAPWIANFYKQPLLIDIVRWYSIVIVINAFSMIQVTRLTKQVDFKTQMKVSLPATILAGILGVFLASEGFGVWSLVYMAIFRSVLDMLFLFYNTKWLPSLVFHVEKFKYHFSFGYKLTFSGLLDIVFNNAYHVIIGKYYQPAILGFYDRANKLKNLPVQTLTTVISRVTYPIFAEFKDDNIRLKNAYQKVIQMLVFIIAPLLLILSVLAEPLFSFLFTDKWLAAVPYFQIICWSGILYPVYAFNLNILKIKGRTDLFLKLEIIKKVLFTSVLLFSVKFGIFGLLYGGVCFSLLAFYVNTYYTGKFINYKPFEQIIDIVPIVFLAFISAVTVYFSDILLVSYFSKDILRLLVGSLVGAFTFLALSYLLKIKPFFVLSQILKNNDSSNQTVSPPDR
jgi:O-antigen/teichoic acid export membrane protein